MASPAGDGDEYALGGVYMPAAGAFSMTTLLGTAFTSLSRFLSADFWVSDVRPMRRLSHLYVRATRTISGHGLSAIVMRASGLRPISSEVDIASSAPSARS
ncbi:MAG: hypothetical protein R3B51_08400 [Thermodesulfobacteriota bacterium]